MCQNDKCPSFSKCYRAQVVPTPHRQAYTSFTPKPGEEKCDKFAEFQPGITCPQCEKTSYSKGDIENKYCGKCRKYHRNMKCKQCPNKLQPDVDTIPGFCPECSKIFTDPHEYVPPWIK